MASACQVPRGRRPDDFQRQAEQAPPGLVAEFIDFVLHNKKWWLTPIIVVLLVLGLLVLLSGTGRGAVHLHAVLNRRLSAAPSGDNSRYCP